MAFIYKITDTTNGMCYVGYTKFKLQTRFAQHVQSSRRFDKSSLLHKAMCKRGPEYFTIEILEEHTDVLYLHQERESYWICTENTIYPNGYNLQPGGEGNKSSTKKRAVSVYDRDLTYVSTFQSILECSEWMGVNHSRIAVACKNASNSKSSRVDNFYVCYKEGVPVVRNYDYLRERNNTWLAEHNKGTSREDHSRFMKELMKTKRDATVYQFIHDIKGSFRGTKHGLKELDPSISIGELGMMVRGKYKTHKGWKVDLSNAIQIKNLH